MKEPSRQHFHQHLRQHLQYTLITRPCPFTPYDDVSVSWFVDLCQQVLAYHKRTTRKVSQEIAINYHYYFWQLTNNIFPPNLTGLTFTCQN